MEWVFGRKGEASHYQVPPDTASTLAGILRRAGLPTNPPSPNNPHNPVPVHQDGYFNQPTDVAWDAQGNAYFSDGYVNSGREGQQPGRMDDVLGIGWIHAIACPSENEIWVAELLNWRVQKLVVKAAQRRAR